ncbi:ATP-grasp domain-containing protein [Streptomyces sp. SID8375]|uniref:ATP-grasp domain-containing protein n=1 Tax=unclassified Streptomyces TaxID=2593676 RepID=UPI000366479E|nr:MULTISPECIES: ATP-grasp domain-containing protein [unclassified Streptomyces]MYX11104.1 ATP-grasp domain-containing protein [Streptomyces sp. SID8375]
MSILLLHTRNLSRRKHLARVRDYAREHGERLLMIMKDATWESSYVDCVVPADTTSIEETVAAVRTLIAAEEEPVRGIVTFVEQSVPAAAAVAAELGLPSIGEKAAYLARDKYAMRSAFGEAGLAQPGFQLATDLDAAVKGAAELGYPLVLKPLIGGGSKYVRRVDNDAELAEHFAPLQRGAWTGFAHDPLHTRTRAQYDEALLLEAYVPGSEISVESLVIDGETRIVAVHDKPLPMEGPFFEEVYYTTPTRLPDGLVRRITAAVGAAHEALGITTGATHTEFRITADGEPYILETAARLGGGPVYQSVLLSTGIDMVEAQLDLATGRAPRLDVAGPPRPTGFYLFFAERAGELVGVAGLDQVETDDRVSEIMLYGQPGDQVLVPPHASAAHGHVVFSAATAEAVEEAFHEFRDAIAVEVR